MKNIFDYKHVKQTSVIVLFDTKTNELAGKIIANWSDNPMGTVCTAQVIIYGDEKRGIKLKANKHILIGKAGGYGYDKLSSAIASAINNNTTQDLRAKFSGAGIGSTECIKFFNALGLNLVSLL